MSKVDRKEETPLDVTYEIHIAVTDKATADVIHQQLSSRGIGVKRLSPAEVTKIGMSFSVGKGSLQASPEEILQLM